MPQKPLSVPLFCQNLTTVILCYQAVQINFLTNCKRSKILQKDLSSKLGSRNTSNPFFKNSTGYQSTEESSTNLNPVLQFFLWNLPTLSVWTFYCLLSIQTISLYLRNKKPFRIPLTETKTFGERAFSFTRPKQWNSLPYDVRRSPSLFSFKKALKTYLFKSAYE